MHVTDGEEAAAARISPLVSEDGAPDVEPDALSRASLHHGGRLLPSAYASAARDEREDGRRRLICSRGRGKERSRLARRFQRTVVMFQRDVWRKLGFKVARLNGLLRFFSLSICAKMGRSGNMTCLIANRSTSFSFF